MGTIYKITNLKTGLCYIGQTRQAPETRWKDHLRSVNYAYLQHLKIYAAMNSYGAENFIFEILEQVPLAELDAREIYWIAYYNSFYNGYNMTPGGEFERKRILEDQKQEVINKYHKLKSARKTAEYFQVDHSTVDKFLNGLNINRYTQGERYGRKLTIEKDGVIKEFNSIIEAGEWFVKNNIVRAKSAANTRISIRKALNNNRPYYGYRLFEQE